MAESTLSITYSDIQAEIGAFLHHGADPTTWSAAEVGRVDRFIQAGLRQFYYPPQMEGVEAGYRWSFMYPTTTITTVVGDRDYDLPDLFGRLDSELYFDETQVLTRAIRQVSEARMMEFIQYSEDTGKPDFCAVRFKTSDNTSGQRMELLLWPIPDAVYTLTYRYEGYAGKLDATNRKYPLGGMKFGECIIESCLAVAEQRGNDEDGLHQRQFKALLAAAVANDRRNGARNFGHMGGNNIRNFEKDCYKQTSYPITYKGVTW